MTSSHTRRQEIEALLGEERWDFEDLRHHLEIPVHVLKEDLRHIQRSVRATGARLHASPPRCAACGFRLREGSLSPPGRCPRCHDHRIRGPELWITLPPARAADGGGSG
jgi:predicted Zn-ribbon and HTH transcriptional regulator